MALPTRSRGSSGLMAIPAGMTQIELENALAGARKANQSAIAISEVTGLQAALDSKLTVVSALADLPTPVGDEIILTAGETYVLSGAIDLGSYAIRLSAGTVLRGLGSDSIMSSNASGVIRATNLAAPIIMREFSVIASGGPALALTGTTSYPLVMSYMTFSGDSVGTVSGFDVQAFKDCLFDADDGLILTGTTNEIFISQCPFYGIASGNAAITLDSALVATRAELVSNFFKHDAAGIPIRAEGGYTVTYGRVTGSMLEGPTTMLDGLAVSDDNWWFYENDTVANSRVAAQSYLTASATTVITTQDVFVPVTGGFTVAALTQRMELDGTNELTYTGGEPVLATFNASFTVDPSNNDRVAFRASKNGTTLDYSETIIEQGAGAGSSPRIGSVIALIELVTGDTIGLSVANKSNTNDIPWLTATFAVNAG